MSWQTDFKRRFGYWPGELPPAHEVQGRSTADRAARDVATPSGQADAPKPGPDRSSIHEIDDVAGTPSASIEKGDASSPAASQAEAGDSEGSSASSPEPVPDPAAGHWASDPDVEILADDAEVAFEPDFELDEELPRGAIVVRLAPADRRLLERQAKARGATPENYAGDLLVFALHEDHTLEGRAVTVTIVNPSPIAETIEAAKQRIRNGGPRKSRAGEFVKPGRDDVDSDPDGAAEAPKHPRGGRRGELDYGKAQPWKPSPRPSNFEPLPAADVARLRELVEVRKLGLTAIASIMRQPYALLSETMEQHRIGAGFPDEGGSR